jgi:hypothetical protein
MASQRALQAGGVEGSVKFELQPIESAAPLTHSHRNGV